MPARAGGVFCRAVAALREGRWITRDRVLLWGLALAAISSLFLVAYVLWATRGLTSNGGPRLAGNFINYYAGARAAASGRDPLVYDREWFRAFEATIIGSAGGRFYSYPPIATLLSLPLAAFSYVPAMVLWTLIGAGLCFFLLKALVGRAAAAVAVIGAPAAWLNVFEGQNGYFSAGLLGGGMMLLERRPALAGICFGCVAYKPHLGVLLPFALAARRQWRAFAAAAATVAGLVLASIGLFGTAAWTGFFTQMAYQKDAIEFSMVGALDLVPAIFDVAREFGATPTVAYAAQLVSAAAALFAVAVVWRRTAGFEVKAAAVAVATFLATPYASGYDEVVLIFAAAWLFREGARTGFLPWERIAVVALLILPALRVGLAAVPLAPVILWLTLIGLLRRALAAAAGSDIVATRLPA